MVTIKDTEIPIQYDEGEVPSFTIDELKKNFKTLASELEDGGINLNSLIEIEKRKEKTLKNTEQPPYFRNYTPTINDYLARAQTNQECKEIIEFCLKKGEISSNEASDLLNKLEKEGPDTFGTRKPGYYDSKL